MMGMLLLGEIMESGNEYTEQFICPHCGNEMCTESYNQEVFEEDTMYRKMCLKCNEIVYFRIKIAILFKIDPF